MFVMPEAAAFERAVFDDPLCGAPGIGETPFIRSRLIHDCKCGDGPAVFARVDVLIHARYSLAAARRIAQLEILGAMLAFDQVGILAGIERAFGRGEERFQIAAD
jgi:hypothetical protein